MLLRSTGRETVGQPASMGARARAREMKLAGATARGPMARRNSHLHTAKILQLPDLPSSWRSGRGEDPRFLAAVADVGERLVT
jgi:hypothetical protein